MKKVSLILGLLLLTTFIFATQMNVVGEVFSSAS